ncbi:MAG: lipopolysaccharide biosynthesis protein [Rhizobiaceae bacterium]
MTVQSVSQSLVNIIDIRLNRIGISRAQIVDYAALLSGQVGRLIFSMIYFVILARTLTLGDFGIFASCSAIGIVLSRLVGLGYISPLFRIATTKPTLIGAYTGGFLIACLISMPLVLAAGGLIYATLYASLIPLEVFFLVILAEAICWRGIETTIIVCNGQNRYSTGAMLGISGVAIKAIAAIVLMTNGDPTLIAWAPIYFSSLLLIMLAGIVFIYPKQRLRWKPRAWFGRASDAMGVSAAETLFYLQAEMDKVLVLALGGEALSGLYAIVMRLVDLTAVPLRAFSTMLTQWIMRSRKSGNAARTGLKLDFLIGVTSVAAIVAIATLLSFAPNLLGENIALGASFLWLVFLVPAFRNSIELHTELLYGHQFMASRVVLLAYLGTLKAFLIALVLGHTKDFAEVALLMNVIFGMLYLASALVTYSRLNRKSLAS